jgi:ABC-type proline/glycine betaine transport system permease subunit
VPATGAAPPLATTLLIYGVIALLLIFRYSRPMRMTVTRMWIGPVIFLAMTAFAIWGEQQAMPSPPALIIVALAAGAVLGIPFGVLRGMHTSVRATERPDVMMLGPSWIVAVVWLGAFFIRAGLRIAFMGTPFAMPLGDGLLTFAIAMLVTSYYVIYRKYRSLEHEAGQI